MDLHDFDFELPDALVATHPKPQRSSSRLLVWQAGTPEFQDAHFPDLLDVLNPGDLLVVNDTRVIKAQLHGHKVSGGKASLLVERILEDACQAWGHLNTNHRVQPGQAFTFGGVSAHLVERASDGLARLVFDQPVADVLAQHGELPLPPYMRRQAAELDHERYQTVFARHAGAIAAPTAALHFDDNLCARCDQHGLLRASLTLHVGSGTFKPVTTQDIASHTLHSETMCVSEDLCAAWQAARQRGNRVVAIGTTVVRALESAYRDGSLQPFYGETNRFIMPGDRFHAIDAMITNFHLPRSTLLMLVAAWGGWSTTMAAYRHAIAARYHFYSYGDAMLVLGPQATCMGTS